MSRRAGTPKMGRRHPVKRLRRLRELRDKLVFERYFKLGKRERRRRLKHICQLYALELGRLARLLERGDACIAWVAPQDLGEVIVRFNLRRDMNGPY